MNFHDWYTDTVDIWRVVPVQDESLTRHERRELYRNIPCRLYQVEAPEIPDIRAFASGPNHFFEPFGAIMPGLAHQEIRLLQQERVKGGVEDEPGGAHKAAQTG